MKLNSKGLKKLTAKVFRGEKISSTIKPISKIPRGGSEQKVADRQSNSTRIMREAKPTKNQLTVGKGSQSTRGHVGYPISNETRAKSAKRRLDDVQRAIRSDKAGKPPKANINPFSEGKMALRTGAKATKSKSTGRMTTSKGGGGGMGFGGPAAGLGSSRQKITRKKKMM